MQFGKGEWSGSGTSRSGEAEGLPLAARARRKALRSNSATPVASSAKPGSLAPVVRVARAREALFHAAPGPAAVAIKCEPFVLKR